MNTNFDSLIILAEKSQFNRAGKLYTRLSTANKHPFILTGHNIEIKDEQYSVTSIESYQKIFKIDYSEVRRETYGLFHQLAGKKINGGRTLKEFTTYKGVSLWDLNTQFIFSELLPILYDFNIIENILELEKPREVHVIGDTHAIEKIIELICRKKRIKFIKYKNYYNASLCLKRIFDKFVILAKRVKSAFVNFYSLVLNLSKYKNLNKKYKIIFFAPPEERFFISMLPVILKYDNKEQLVINPFLSECAKRMKEKDIFYMDFNGYNIFCFLSFENKRFLKKIKDTIYASGVFVNIFYKEMPIGILLVKIFEKSVNEGFPGKIREIDIIREIILSYEPKAVIVVNSSVSVALVAKSLSVLVVAIQGAHAEEFIKFNPVVADVFAVDGNYWKEYLHRCSVNLNNIQVTGIPRFDILQDKNFLARNLDLLRDIDKSKKIIVFASTYFSLAMGAIGYHGREQVKKICEAIKKINDVHLIIKMHPYDNDFKTYRDIAKETELTDYTIIRDVEMLKLLCNCDLLLVTFSSTAGYEAVLLNKTVISISEESDFNLGDFWDFNRYGAVIVCDDLAKLESHIRDSLYNTQTESRLKTNRERYFLEHAYKIDGKSGERIKNVIEQFV